MITKNKQQQNIKEVQNFVRKEPTTSSGTGHIPTFVNWNGVQSIWPYNYGYEIQFCKDLMIIVLNCKRS